MPEHILTALGTDVETACADTAFNGLRLLGLTNKQIERLDRIICGTQTVEGAAHLRPEHLAVFDCATKCGSTGTRFIATEGHIRMMAASQPFISGAISKTINLPNEADVDDIAAAYRLSWELGLKANALYRDGSKLSQQLSTTSDVEDDVDEEAVEAALEEVTAEVADAATVVAHSIVASDPEVEAEAEPKYVERIVERIVERPLRRRLPDTRRSLTHRFNVAGHEGYLTVGLYEDGSPGELFITMSKEGSTIGGLMDSLGTAISVALQYGVPIDSLVNKFAHQRFEPMGMTTSRDIPFAKSLVDYIFRWMGMEFIPGYREANAPRREPAVGDRGTREVKGGHDVVGDQDDRRIHFRADGTRGGVCPTEGGRWRPGEDRRCDDAATFGWHDAANDHWLRDGELRGGERVGLAHARPVECLAPGRRARVRRLRRDHGPERHVLQVPELRELHGMQLIP